jgi:hypothetical protein
MPVSAAQNWAPGAHVSASGWARASPPARRTTLPPTAAGAGAERPGGAGGCVLPVLVHRAAGALPPRRERRPGVIPPVRGN